MTSASAIRFCTTVNAYFEVEVAALDPVLRLAVVDVHVGVGRAPSPRLDDDRRARLAADEADGRLRRALPICAAGTFTCAPRSVRMPSTERVTIAMRSPCCAGLPVHDLVRLRLRRELEQLAHAHEVFRGFLRRAARRRADREVDAARVLSSRDSMFELPAS